jgi:peptidoglycan hydrolase-like protein with peptidoglycan-binding domain
MLALALPLVAGAAERIRDVQTELKTQGFYYGDLNGENTSETVAAIRRYQIRNGLEVTGTLTKETLDALGIGGAAPREPAPAPTTPKPRPRAAPRSEPVESADKDFLRREETVRPAPQPAPPPTNYDPSVVAPPAPLNPPSADFPVLFANTPYATAPREVQESTLRRAQAALSSRGFYREVIDGLPGPATEEALLSYQRSLRLPLTGRLDLETLSNLRLLPGRPPIPVRGTVRMPSNGPRVYRGIIVR